MRESPLFLRCYDLLRWLIPLTLKFPRQHRGVLAKAIQRIALELHGHLFEAVYVDSRYAAHADAKLQRLRAYVRLARDFEIVSFGQYGHASRLLDEVGRLLGAWRKTLAAREVSRPA